MRGAIVAALILALAPATAFARIAEPKASAPPVALRPEPLEGKSGCDLWKGTVSGNDPSVLVELLLCEGLGGAVTGQLQWSSTLSGYSVRELTGQWSADREKLLLQDTSIVVDKPSRGWKFCTVDRYDLTRAAKDRLSGSYTASKCPDTATVELSLVPRPPPPVVIPSPEPEGDPPSHPDRPDSDVPEPKLEENSSACLCSTPGGPSHPFGPFSFGIAAMLVLLRRQRRSSV